MQTKIIFLILIIAQDGLSQINGRSLAIKDFYVAEDSEGHKKAMDCAKKINKNLDIICTNIINCISDVNNYKNANSIVKIFFKGDTRETIVVHKGEESGTRKVVTRTDSVDFILSCSVTYEEDTDGFYFLIKITFHNAVQHYNEITEKLIIKNSQLTDSNRDWLIEQLTQKMLKASGILHVSHDSTSIQSDTSLSNISGQIDTTIVDSDETPRPDRSICPYCDVINKRPIWCSAGSGVVTAICLGFSVKFKNDWDATYKNSNGFISRDKYNRENAKYKLWQIGGGIGAIVTLSSCACILKKHMKSKKIANSFQVSGNLNTIGLTINF